VASERPNFLLLAAGLVACGAGVATVPALPELAGRDPEVRAAVERMHGELAAAPEDAALRTEWAMLLDANELDAAALAAWEQVCVLTPAEPRAWYHVARVRERRGDLDGAFVALERVLTLATDYAPAHGRLGRLRLEAGALDSAEPELLRALELEPGAAGPVLALARLALLRGDPRAALARLAPLLAENPREPYANGLAARAHAALGDERAAARALAAEELAGAPSTRDPWQAEVQRRALGLKVRIDRAKARVAAGDPAAAWKELEPLAERAGELALVDTQFQVLIAWGKPEEVLVRHAELAPELAQSSLLAMKKVLALRALGRADEALAALAQEIRRNPAHPNGPALQGEILGALGRHAESAQAFERARANGDRTLATALALASALGASGDSGRELAELARVAEEFPWAPKPCAERARALARTGRGDEARAELQRAVERGLEPERAAELTRELEEPR
jgi:tetratricopeptide (TPR) repeat protein